MRIVYLHQYFNTPSMKGGTRSYEMARRLAASGHEVHMVTSDRTLTGENGRVSNVDGIVVHWLPVPYSNMMTYRDRIKSFFRFAWLSSRIAASLNPDLVFATSTPLTIALPAVYASWRKKVPMVFEVRDLWPEVPIALGVIHNRLLAFGSRRLEQFAYRHSARIVALSPGMKEGVIAAGYPADRIVVIPNACDPSLFEVDAALGGAFRESYDWLKNRPLVLYTGTLGRVNGVSYMVHLAAAVLERDEDIRFVTIGTGGEEAIIRQLAQHLNVLDRNFFMLDPIPKTEVPAALAAADIATSFVIDVQALWANSANKFFDALAAGTPIAINHRGWLADLIDERRVGLVLSANDIERAADQLVAALHDRDWLRITGIEARRLGKERFNRDTLASELEAVLSEATQRSLADAATFHGNATMQ